MRADDWMQLYISTHSLTRRLTGGSPGTGKGAEDFNSQPHKEADAIPSKSLNQKEISTHSLTRRLTSDRGYFQG